MYALTQPRPMLSFVFRLPLQPSVNVTLDTLHLVFSAFGTVQKIATFEKQTGFQALVQYPDAQTAEQVQGDFVLRCDLLEGSRGNAWPLAIN